jgi:predicted  nucleic acid-binding Zn-ribbon protein
MALKVEISAGEFLDKVTILEIKTDRIQDPEKLANVAKELELLRHTWATSPLSMVDVGDQVAQLKTVNESLWDIEDQIRRCESAGTFSAEFIQLARSVYQHNDQRAAIKRELNKILGSDLVEEKSYPDYSPPSTET